MSTWNSKTPPLPPTFAPPAWEKHRSAIEAEWKAAQDWADSQRLGGWNDARVEDHLVKTFHDLRAKYGVPDSPDAHKADTDFYAHLKNRK